MKFLQLEILNLASLDKRDGEVINFEEGALGESTIFSIVGPTGSGKSTIGRSIIRLYDPTAGEIIFKDQDISGKMDKATTKSLRMNMQMIFQDPMASLNPRKKVLDLIALGLDIHHPELSEEERKNNA